MHWNQKLKSLIDETAQTLQGIQFWVQRPSYSSYSFESSGVSVYKLHTWI